MAQVRYSPRKMDLEKLVSVLIEEHDIMKKGLARVRVAAERRDFETVRNELKVLEPVFRQHVADEEAQILGLLIKQVGVKGAAEEIRVFQQHRPIYQLMTKAMELAALSASDLEASQAELIALFNVHATAEETRIFPRAVSFHR